MVGDAVRQGIVLAVDVVGESAGDSVFGPFEDRQVRRARKWNAPTVRWRRQ